MEAVHIPGPSAEDEYDVTAYDVATACSVPEDDVLFVFKVRTSSNIGYCELIYKQGPSAGCVAARSQTINLPAPLFSSTAIGSIKEEGGARVTYIDRLGEVQTLFFFLSKEQERGSSSASSSSLSQSSLSFSSSTSSSTSSTWKIKEH